MATDRIPAPDHDAIRARHAASTPGDWRHADCIAPKVVIYAIPTSRPTGRDDVLYLGATYADGDGQGRRNMEFIAHAHQDIPALLDEVEQLRSALDYLRRKIDGYDVTFEVAEEIASGAVSQDGSARTEPDHA